MQVLFFLPAPPLCFWHRAKCRDALLCNVVNDFHRKIFFQNKRLNSILSEFLIAIWNYFGAFTKRADYFDTFSME